MSCPLARPIGGASERPIFIGAIGTSLTFGVDLPDPARQAWPRVLQSMLRSRDGFARGHGNRSVSVKSLYALP